MRHVFLKNAMEYAGYLCSEIAGTCKNCRDLQKLQFDEKEKKK